MSGRKEIRQNKIIKKSSEMDRTFFSYFALSIPVC
jgi:hypothetical protein